MASQYGRYGYRRITVELPQHSKPPLYSLSFDLIEGFSIHSRRARICKAASVSFMENTFAADLVLQRVEAVGRFCLGFRL